MQRLLIDGGRRLEGEVPIHGAKNAVLPILAATLLGGRSTLYNCPALSDVDAAGKILAMLGCILERQDDRITVDARDITYLDLPEQLMREMRSSILFLGAILARCGRACLSFPGGCELGARPIDLHIEGLRRLGASIVEEHGCLRCRIDGRFRGAEITLPFPSVGATENILLAAVTAEGRTILHNAAREPEICDLADFLNACGGAVTVEGDCITVEGGEALHDGVHRVIPDRIEAATYLCAGAATGGELLLAGVCPRHLSAVLPMLEKAGCRIEAGENSIHLRAPARLSAVDSVKTMPYPGFPTDAQAPLMAALCTAQGTSMFVENIFEARYKHVGELLRMGARIEVEGRVALVRGVESLSGANLCCTDLRGGAAMVIAALAAEGRSTLIGLRHIDRGYQDLEQGLCRVGAKISRER